ncbi:MFS general substrate transporter [Mycena leptocephala]|nr:MFS general substrate transporter [Mycena leptocephala]
MPDSVSLFNRSLLCFSIAANALCAGGVFTFPLLSPVLAQHVKLTQPQLTTIVLAGMAGQYPCTPLVGKIVDSHGPWLCSLIASLLFSLAFGGFSYQVHYMLEATQPSQASVAALVVLFALAGFATVFSYFSSLFAATRNFPRYPGVASGTVMALFGLSPLFLSFVASSFFTDGAASLDLVQFLAFLAILTGIVHIIGASNLRVFNNHLPVVVPLQNDESDETTALLCPEGRNNGNGSSLELVRDPYFWVFFMLLAVTLGPCEMVLSNVGSIVLSLPSASVTAYSGSSGAAALQVKALAISNTVTRLLTGPIADFVSPVVISEPPSPRKHYISRAVFLVVPAVVLALTSLWMEVAVRSQADLWVLSVGTGMAYGATFTVLPSIITSVWGTQNAGRNFGIVVYAPLTGTTIFSYLYAFIFAYHTPSGGFCRGPSCWQTTFLISGGLQVVAIFWSLLLWRGWKGLL